MTVRATRSLQLPRAAALLALVACNSGKDDSGTDGIDTDDPAGTGTGVGTGTGGPGTATGAGTGTGVGTGTGGPGTATGTATGATGTGTGSTTDCTRGGIALTIGTGKDAYVEVHENDDVTIVHGPQGGWHLDTAGFVVGSSNLVSVSYEVYSVDLGQVIGGIGVPQWNVALTDYDPDTCTGVFFGQESRLDTAPPTNYTGTMEELVCSLDGRPLDWTITVTDLNTKISQTATVRVTAQNDPVDELTCP